MHIEKIKQAMRENGKQFVLVLGVIGILALIYYRSGVRCLLKYIVGFPCPGCGLTRAWISFLKMDFKAAFKWHPLFWIVPIIIIIGVFMKGKPFKSKRTNLTFWIFLSLLVLGVYITRMVKLFPYEQPMDYNKQSVAYKWIISKIIP